MLFGITLTQLFAGGLAFVLGGLGGYAFYSFQATKAGRDLAAEKRRAEREAQAERERLLEKARSEAKDFETRMKSELTAEKDRLTKLEERIQAKEDKLYEDQARAEEAEEKARAKSKELDELRKGVEAEHVAVQETLAATAQLSREEAKAQLFTEVERQHRDLLASRVRQVDEEFERAAKEKAANFIGQAVQRLASEVTRESTVTTVQLPDDAAKGKIIGREGRNIVSLEKATGVDIIIDDSPETILVSGFDLVRRYVAKLAIEELVADGRIHPARIEEVVAKQQERVSEMVRSFAEKACSELGIPPFAPEIMDLLGRLRFRTSFGQNVLKHTLECARLAALLAADLGVDPEKAKKAALLHDIGKSLSAEMEGSHAVLGATVLKRYGIDPEIIHAVEAHHEDIPMETTLDFIVSASDAISAARPGARSESTENYIQRLHELENIASSHRGVAKAYAIQAGREIRIHVDPDKVDDLALAKLGAEVAKEIEQKLTYPGEIRITVMREKRAVEYAR